MSGAPTSSETIESIINEAASGDRRGGALSTDDIRALADKVELLTADFGRWDAYKAASVEYIAAFKTEIDWHWRIRLAVSIACGVLVLFLATCLVLGVLFAEQLFGKNQGHSLTALIVTTVTGCVVVTIAATKGAFATMAERNAGLPLPDHIKELVTAGKGIIGGGHG
jgi:hypothetical protein